MKYRIGFVSNSSSSSFSIRRDYISKSQIRAVMREAEAAGNEYDCWRFKHKGRYFTGYTDMDNFDIEECMRNLGVDTSKLEFGE